MGEPAVKKENAIDKEALSIIKGLVKENCAYGHHFTPDCKSPSFKKAIDLLVKNGIMVYKPWKDCNNYTYQEYYFDKRRKDGGLK